MRFYQLTQEEVEKALNTNFHQGLTDEEMKRRVQEFGYNELKQGEKQSALLILDRKSVV